MPETSQPLWHFDLSRTAWCSLQVIGYAWLKIFNQPMACSPTDYSTHLFGLYGASNVLFISLTLRHKAFTIFDPDIIGTPGLHSMNCYEVAICDITSPIKPLSRIFFPILLRHIFRHTLSHLVTHHVT